LENVVRFWEWKKGRVEVPAHEAIAFKIWELLPTVGTTDMHEQSELLGKMIAEAKAVIDTEKSIFDRENNAEINDLLLAATCLPNPNEYEHNEISIGHAKSKGEIVTYKFVKSKQLNLVSRRWLFVGKS